MVLRYTKDILEPEILQLRGFTLSAPGRPLRYVEDLRKPVLILAEEGGCNHAVSVDVQFTGLDGKLVASFNARTRAYCYSCSLTQEEAHTIENIYRGGYMDFDMERVAKT